MNCDTTTTATAGTTLVQKAREATARAAALVEEQKLAAFKKANEHRAAVDGKQFTGNNLKCLLSVKNSWERWVAI